MVSKKLTLNNASGFHMRPASVFATAMAKFQSDVTIDFNSSKINAKSLLNIIAAVVDCNGPDEEEALAKAVELIEGGLGE